MAERQPQLRVVDAKTGELHETCPTCDEWARKYNGVLSQLGQMRAQLHPEEAHALFPVAKRLHDYWRERCNHPRAAFEIEEFKQARPRLEQHGEEMCRHAIDGAAYDCFTTPRKNGTIKRHDDWELIMRKGKFEEFANKAPHHLPKPEHVKALANALAFLDKGKPFGECVAEAQERLT